MIRICAWHRRYWNRPKLIGIKRPLFNLSVTHGMCPACIVRFLEDEIPRMVPNGQMPDEDAQTAEAHPHDV